MEVDRHRYHPDALLALCDRLDPDDPSLAEEVRLATEQPDEYRVRFEERLLERGIEPGVPLVVDATGLTWIALLDGLKERARLIEVDWRQEPTEVMSAIDVLLGGSDPARWTWVDVPWWSQAPTASFLRAIGARLLPQGRILACLRSACARYLIDADSYPLMVVTQSQFAEIQALAARTGYGPVVACLEGQEF